jgi:tRNA(Ile)-lysidine synthase
MASSGKRKRSSAAVGIVSHVAARLSEIAGPGDRIVLGLSGGIDSIVLLDVLARLAPRLRLRLETLHVNHGLSPNADAWARFCKAVSRRLGVRARVVKVDVVRANSIERAAREARYEALLGARADHVVLAHNRDDQAETVLLQLLRGAGVKGLAAMAFVRAARGSASCVLRPLLEVPRADIERYAKRRKLEWIEDESNTDVRYTRNWLRRELIPHLARRVPAYREALTRAARNCGEAAQLLDELALLDLAAVASDDTLRVEALRAMSAARAKNVLRFVIDARGWRMPDAARLDEALRQALRARAGARVAVNLGSCELRRHAAAIHLVPLGAGADAGEPIAWRGEARLTLPDASVLTMRRARGNGLSAARLAGAEVTIRRRRGGERLRLDAARPRRTVKNLLQEAGLPPWQRERVPFIYCGDELACVPGLGVDYRFRARASEPSVVPEWSSGASLNRRGSAIKP